MHFSITLFNSSCYIYILFSSCLDANDSLFFVVFLYGLVNFFKV